MQKISIKKIVPALPKDFVRNAFRDISLPTAAVFVDIHFTLLPQLFQSRFTAVFSHSHGKQAGVFRSPAEYENFARSLAKKYLSRPNFAERVISQLKKHTDWLNNFIKKYPTLSAFFKHKEKFFQKYLEFFAYHQATHFGGNYLSEMPTPAKKKVQAERIVKKLAAVYKYNEMVVPNLEKYFRKLKITEYLPEEIGKVKQEKVSSGRSVIGLLGKRSALSKIEASRLAKEIFLRQKSKHFSADKIRGTTVVKGDYIGKVRLITDLNRLNSLKRGEILVTTMTRPQYNHILRFAGAIVTDEGGVMDHAAILAREFKIPCIVGTKIATKVFRSGDLVEVDAGKGIITKIKN